MRLTLRTLLAYLDDTLEPSEIKQIGQKVAESDTAQELITRIKQVTRRRRLTTPPDTGPGAKLDAKDKDGTTPLMIADGTKSNFRRWDSTAALLRKLLAESPAQP